MNEQELTKRCLINKDALETYPFKDKKYGGLPVLRHKSNNKWFGLIFYLENVLYINLKAEPDIICILKEQYPEIITSAWHMNKSHWYKVDVNKMKQEALDVLVKRSFDITSAKIKKSRPQI